VGVGLDEFVEEYEGFGVLAILEQTGGLVGPLIADGILHVAAPDPVIEPRNGGDYSKLLTEMKGLVFGVFVGLRGLPSGSAKRFAVDFRGAVGHA